MGYFLIPYRVEVVLDHRLFVGQGPTLPYTNLRNEPVVVGSCIYVTVPTAVDAQVRTGSSLMKVWLNDNHSPVIEVNVVRPPILDNELSDVSLSAGLNRFLVATVSGIYSFSFYFRITDRDGNAIPGLEFVSAKKCFHHAD